MRRCVYIGENIECFTIQKSYFFLLTHSPSKISSHQHSSQRWKWKGSCIVKYGFRLILLKQKFILFKFGFNKWLKSEFIKISNVFCRHYNLSVLVPISEFTAIFWLKVRSIPDELAGTQNRYLSYQFCEIGKYSTVIFPKFEGIIYPQALQCRFIEI
jgi:hypothetical protein